MAETAGAHTNGSNKPEYGRRLAPHIIDGFAKTDPGREAFTIPRSSDPKDGWRSITFKEYANAINHSAHKIVEACGTPSPGSFPTIAYIGPNDARYIVILIAAIKAGYKALFISPRNTQEGQMSLFEKTDCNILAFAKPFRAVIQPWLQEREMKTVEVGPLETWFPEEEAEHFPYNKTFEEAEWEPFAVLHTSGSTGIPKPVVLKHGLMAVNDAMRNSPEFRGTVTWLRGLVGSLKRFFAPMPLFHAAGIFFFVFSTIFYGTSIALGIGDRPLSTELALECLENANVDGAFFPPSILEEISHSEEYIQILAKLKSVAFAGGNLNKEAGDRLTSYGIKLSNAIGATEYAIPLYYQPKPELWQWFIFNSDLVGAQWRKVEGTEDVYRFVMVRKDKHPGTQGIFYTFPDIDEYDTCDLYRPHPTLPDHWIYYGRSDDIIVFSTGEKLNPVTIEQIITDHPGVKGVLVVGSNHFQPGLLVEPATTPRNKQEAEEFLDSVWTYIVKANKETVAHGQIGREFIRLSDPNKPFERAGKGTIQRASTLKLYKDEIEKLYEGTSKEFDTLITHIDVSSEDTLADSIVELFRDGVRSKGELERDTDFFSAGVDSLQVINASRLLRSGLKASGFHVDAAMLAARVIYGNPTPRRLAQYIHSIIKGETHPRTENNEVHELQSMKSLREKYTDHLPTKKEGRSDPLDDAQTIILTGSTGMLGSYMLDFMVKNPAVKKVICLNRGEDGGAKRQVQVAKDRGLSPDFESKTEFLRADMSRSDFGLPADVYNQLLNEVDRIIHNAWPVNFNMPVESFDPHIRSVRNVADFATNSLKRVAVVFISSIGTVDHWNSANGKVPEGRLEDLKLAGGGYGRSKMVGNLILEDVSKVGDFPAAIIRVGQIAGPEAEAGYWNKQEWLPSIIASSLHIGALPADLGIMQQVDWTPAEGIANLVLEVGGISQKLAAEDITGYYHGVNPSATTWAELAPAVQEFYGKERIRELISFKDWIARLEQSQVDDTQNIDKNPGVKLIDSYRRMSEAGQQPIVFEMERTTERSATMRSVKAVTPEIMKHWCKQWGF
ncbi:acetyl-CoA synthetase-like protein [Hypoxylon trugodes]|uniref:acetyl-CoA synthetase-like protein n=1 Tax=Hypoxylon trugodes TaxID=326681 RepID=UPI0021A0ADC0|nr:acetyl-CoA synthetase-like protein [Hypoxylon trugodes]KAI1383800.1 acetyl-CoA synthetase-like protein [Hypoxylon trugodes]